MNDGLGVQPDWESWWDVAVAVAAITWIDLAYSLIRSELLPTYRINIQLDRRWMYVNSGRHSGQGTMFGVFKLDFDSYERYLDLDTGVLHRIWSRIYLAQWFGLGSHFGTNASFVLISNMLMLIVLEHFPINGFIPKRARQPLARGGLRGRAPRRIPYFD